ncbi:MAG: His/Gly/Thr/Pro-type tRNA ligase C-terminal domain-containing protein, partial [Cyanobacteria bacterium J06639_1]
GDDYIQQSKELAPKFLRLLDPTAAELKNFVTGANEIGFHVVGANWDEAFPKPDRVVDLRKAQAGDRAVHDPEQVLQTARGIEIGHIFQLGTKYSQAMGATYTREDGKSAPLVMGCYGIGVSRLAQAAVEQSYDDRGIIWPAAIAPYHCIIVVPNVKDDTQMQVALDLASQLEAAGIETLLDDRDERAGVKFADAELIGIPFRITTGRSLKQQKVELSDRHTGEKEDIPLSEIVATLDKRLQAALT